MPQIDYKLKIRLILSLLAISTFAICQENKTLDCFTDNNRHMKFCIMSDSKTHDEHFGDCYRLLEITNLKTDSILGKYYLDINRSPDFPYKLNTDFFEKYEIIIIEGVASFYLYSLRFGAISRNVYPSNTNCEFSDGQGSFIDNLNILDMGKTLELRVDECGIHKFDISNINKITEIE